MKNIEEMTIAEAREMLPQCRELLAMFGEREEVTRREAPPFPHVGHNVIVRTVTYHYTGRLVRVTDQDLILEDAAWVADSGRWGNALQTGELSEVEPYPEGQVVIPREMSEVARWNHALPREAK